jgi:hypothetical protein
VQTLSEAISYIHQYANSSRWILDRVRVGIRDKKWFTGLRGGTSITGITKALLILLKRGELRDVVYLQDRVSSIMKDPKAAATSHVRRILATLDHTQHILQVEDLYHSLFYAQMIKMHQTHVTRVKLDGCPFYGAFSEFAGSTYRKARKLQDTSASKEAEEAEFLGIDTPLLHAKLNIHHRKSTIQMPASLDKSHHLVLVDVDEDGERVEFNADDETGAVYVIFSNIPSHSSKVYSHIQAANSSSHIDLTYNTFRVCLRR